MPDVSFTGLAVVAVVAFVVPLLLGLGPRIRLPAVVLEIVAGIIIGPGLDWVEPDLVVEILSLIGLAFLLFLAGLEIELERFRGRFLRLSTLGLVISFGLALAISFGLGAVGLLNDGVVGSMPWSTPTFVAIVLLATSLGLVVPVLKDAGETQSTFGQLTITSASMADFAAVILLSLLFSQESVDTGVKLLLLGGFVLLVVALGLAAAGAGRISRLSESLLRLQDTTAEIRVRGAVMLLLAIIALAEVLGLEVILGAFMAGALLKLIDRDVMMTHPHFWLKLEAIGFGFLIPVFFVNSGLTFDLHSLVASSSTLVRVPVFLVALLIVRGLPALPYRRIVGGRQAVAAALLQATSLPFIVAAAQIGVELGTISNATGAALIAAGLLSVLIFPLTSLTILGGGTKDAEETLSAEAGEGMGTA
jgi:Kef-type K+ transport system membrane component KefB